MLQYSWARKASISCFALHDQAQRHALHPAGRARARQLAPQHRRQREADQIVQRAAGQIGVHQLLVDLAGMRDGFQVTADLVMALNATRSTGSPSAASCPCSTSRMCQLMASPSRSGSVARISLSAPFTAAAMSLILDWRPGVHVPGHGEVFVRLHRAVLGGQVADMPEAGQHFIIAAQILVDGLGLAGGFDDEDIHAGL